MSYVITGYHRNGYYFPGALQSGVWLRNVSEQRLDAEIDAAQAAGWIELRATKESF